MKVLIALLIIVVTAAVPGYVFYNQSSDVEEIHQQIQVTSSEIDGLELDVFRESCPAKDQVVYADIVRRSGDIQVAVKKLDASDWALQFVGDAEKENLRQGSLNLTLALQQKKLKCLQRQYELIGSK